jgi:hypothetical protein
MPPLAPLGAPVTSTSSDEDALAEIQKELDSSKLKPPPPSPGQPLHRSHRRTRSIVINISEIFN